MFNRIFDLLDQDTCIPRVYWAHKIPNARPEMTMVKNLVTGEYQRADEM